MHEKVSPPERPGSDEQSTRGLLELESGKAKKCDEYTYDKTNTATALWTPRGRLVKKKRRVIDSISCVKSGVMLSLNLMRGSKPGQALVGSN